MKTFANSAALVLTVGLSLPAGAIEVIDQVNGQANAAHARPDGAALAAPGPALPYAVPLSALPEPEVFAMMLLGLVLIGWRARRESSDTFQ